MNKRNNSNAINSIDKKVENEGMKKIYFPPSIQEIGKVKHKTKGKVEGFGDLQDYFDS